MIPRGRRLADPRHPVPWRPASRTALLTCALGTSGSKSMGVGAAEPSIVRGGRPSFEAMRAPIRSSGTITRFMGRRDSDSSPIIVDAKGWAARTPASIRIVLPEFPASSDAAGARKPAQPATVDAKAQSLGRPASFFDRDAKGAQAIEGRSAVAAGRIAMDGRRAVGESREQGIAVRDGLVAGWPYPSPYARGGQYS